MKKDNHKISRRAFIKAAGVSAASGLIASSPAIAKTTENGILQVWSCGGLAEAFTPANEEFKQRYDVNIVYTGAFAAALGKSLFGNAETEIFAPRVVKLAKELKDQGKMLWYKPLCYTRYILAVPEGNPAAITNIKDLAKPGVRVVMSFDASPPGGKATMIILKKAGILEAVKKNIVFDGDCVQRTATLLTNGKADVSIVEQRITKLPAFSGKLETIHIEEEFIPPPSGDIYHRHDEMGKES